MNLPPTLDHFGLDHLGASAGRVVSVFDDACGGTYGLGLGGDEAEGIIGVGDRLAIGGDAGDPTELVRR